MRATAVLALVLVFGAETDAADDVKAIQGTWVVTAATFDGAPVNQEARAEALEALKCPRLTFREGKLTFKEWPDSRPARTGEDESSDYRLDPTKNPKQIDLLGSVRGIYELDGDTLKLCLDIRGKENGRPDKFGFDQDKPTVVYYVLKREKQ